MNTRASVTCSCWLSEWLGNAVMIGIATAEPVIEADRKAGKPHGQFLTGVFKLRPSKRKAAILKRVSEGASRVYWQAMQEHRGAIEAILVNHPAPIGTDYPLSGELKAACQAAKSARKRAVQLLVSGILAKMPRSIHSSIREGVAGDLRGSMLSYIELTISGFVPGYPVEVGGVEQEYMAGLEQLAASTSKSDEDEARDRIARISRRKELRPIALSRGSDGRFILDPHSKKYAIVLGLTPKTDRKARKTVIREGVDPISGEFLKATSTLDIVIPIECSMWHEHKFLNGAIRLCSSKVYERDGEWFFAGQFELPKPDKFVGGCVVGVDRGVVYPVAASVVDRAGCVLEVLQPGGGEVGQMIVRYEGMRRTAGNAGRLKTSARYAKAANQELHIQANRIIDLAKRYRAEIAMENLDGLKRVIVTKRKHGAQRNHWQAVLKRAQLGKLETILEYKAALHGVKILNVPAGGTSQTCPHCGHRATENRKTQGHFQCTECGFEANADMNASVVIARRGVLKRKLKKGDKYDVLHKNMVIALKAGDDGGAGLLRLSRQVVVHHGTGVVANDAGQVNLANGALRHPGPKRTKIGKTLGNFSEKSSGYSHRGQALNEFSAEIPRCVVSNLRAGKGRGARCSMSQLELPFV